MVKNRQENRRKAPKTAFKPGESGNPSGRPKRGETFTDLFLGHISKDELAEKLADHIRAGDIPALKYGLDRVEGKPVQEVKVQSDVAIDAPIIIQVAGVHIEHDSDGDEDE